MKPQPSQVKITTVWLEAEGLNNNFIWRLFHCINCRIPLIEYNGTVASIVPGDQPYIPSTRLECKGKVWREDKRYPGESQPFDCGMIYVFMGTSYTLDPKQT